MTKKPKKISVGNFGRFGRYLSVPNRRTTPPTISAPKVIDYWKQQAVFEKSLEIEVGFLTVYQREGVFQQIERHRGTPELLVILDGEVAIPCAPPHDRMKAGQVPCLADIEIFKVPAGSAVLFPTGGWHWAPYPTRDKKVNILVVFKNNTSAEDLEIVDLPEKVAF